MRTWFTIIAVILGASLPPAASGQPPPGGGLTVREAQASKLTGVLFVRGYVFVDRSGRIRLCARPAGSPPSCRGASLALTNVLVAQLEPLQRSASARWSRRAVSLYGRHRGNRLVFAPNVR